MEDPGRSGGTLGSRCPPFGTRNLPKRLHQRCSLFKIVKVCVPLSWKTWMTFCSRRTGRVRQLSRCHWKAWIDGELDQREGELASPLQTPIPAPTILPWAENIRKIHFLLFLEIPTNGWIMFWFKMYSWLYFWSKIQMLCSFLPKRFLHNLFFRSVRSSLIHIQKAGSLYFGIPSTYSMMPGLYFSAGGVFFL